MAEKHPMSDPEHEFWKQNFNTPIPANSQKEFEKWLTPKRAKDYQDYDVQGFFLSGAGTSANGHGTDLFKKPNHPTFSNESMYHSPGIYEGGTWGKGVFNATPHNVNMHGEEGLKNYFKTREKDINLNLPTPQNMFEKYFEEAIKQQGGGF